MYLDILNILWIVGFPAALLVGASSGAVCAAARWIGGVRVESAGLLVIAFSLLGAVLGIAGGASRTPVMGELLPAFVTVIAVLLGYIFTKESMAGLRPAIPYCLIAFLVTSLMGLFFGSAIRGKHEKFERDYEKRLLQYKQVDLELEKLRGVHELEVKKALKMKELGLLQVEEGQAAKSKASR